MKWLRGMAGVFIFAILAGCSGSGNNNSGNLTSGVEIASQVALVDAQDVANTSLSAVSSKGIKLLASKALTSDITTTYYTDPLDVWVYDNSMEALNLINEILCSFDQTQYAQMIDKGDYIALIDVAKCSSKTANMSSQEGNQSSGQSEDIETWVVNSSLVNGVQIVSAWIGMTEQMGPDTQIDLVIHAKATITEGVSDANPFGVFQIDIQMMNASESEVFARGYLKSVSRSDGKVELLFSMSSASAQFPVDEAVHVVMNADGSEGSAIAQHSMGDMGEANYTVAFDANNYLAAKAEESPICLDRKNFVSNVFRYGVYKEDGSHLNLTNPGFGIKFNNGDQPQWGFANYYGIWLPPEIDMVSGLSVTRASNDASSGTTYTTVVADGKLVKHTRGNANLGDFLGDTLYYWNNGNYKVEWNGTDLVIVGQEQCNESGCQQIDASGTVSTTAGMYINLWKDGFGGLFFQVPESGLTDNTVVGIDLAVIATTADLGGETLSLSCYQQCLPPNLTTELLNSNPYFEDSYDVAAPYVYTVSPSDMTLRYGGEPVVPVEDAAMFNWGVQSGPMSSDVSGIENTGEIWMMDVYYTWETGTNNWNKFAGLIDASGNAVAFDPPIKLNYTHTDGKKYMLDFNGFGELNGIPWVQVEGSDMWRPAFNIPDGSSATSNGNTYYIRALEMEQHMIEVDVSVCSALSAETLDLPTQEYVDPNMDSKPAVTDDPAVIKGELQ